MSGYVISLVIQIELYVFCGIEGQFCIDQICPLSLCSHFQFASKVVAFLICLQFQFNPDYIQNSISRSQQVIQSAENESDYVYIYIFIYRNVAQGIRLTPQNKSQ